MASSIIQVSNPYFLGENRSFYDYMVLEALSLYWAEIVEFGEMFFDNEFDEEHEMRFSHLDKLAENQKDFASLNVLSPFKPTLLSAHHSLNCEKSVHFAKEMDFNFELELKFQLEHPIELLENKEKVSFNEMTIVVPNYLPHPAFYLPKVGCENENFETELENDAEYIENEIRKSKLGLEEDIEQIRSCFKIIFSDKNQKNQEKIIEVHFKDMELLLSTTFFIHQLKEYDEYAELLVKLSDINNKIIKDVEKKKLKPVYLYAMKELVGFISTPQLILDELEQFL